MIREKANLICSAGHRHYSPTPDYWVGQTCFKPFENPVGKSGNIRTTAEKCTKPLAKIKSRKEP